MKEIQFPDWEAVLPGSGLPEKVGRGYGSTIRWYLNFCKERRLGVNVQSAREFMAQSQAEHEPEAGKLER